MAKRFTTIENWIEQSSQPKRSKQALLWILATEDPETSGAPVLALLSMAGPSGLTKHDVAEILGVDCYSQLMSLRSLGALDKGTGGTFVLKANSPVLPIGKGTKRHLRPDVRTNPVRTKQPKKILHKKSQPTESKDLSLLRACAPARGKNLVAMPGSIPTTTVTSGKSVKSIRGVVGNRSQRKKKKRKTYSQIPSENPKFREAKIRKPEKWDHWACLGYWLKKFRVAYEVEDGFFVGSSAKVQEKSAWSIWNFVNHESGFNGDLEKWRDYVDWIFAVFLPGADWIDRPIGLGQMVRLPNGEQNFFLQQFRMSKAKLPRKKKTRVTYERKRWGYKKVVVEE